MSLAEIILMNVFKNQALKRQQSEDRILGNISSSFQSQNPDATPEQFAKYLTTNPMALKYLDKSTIQGAVGNLTDVSRMDYYDAQSELARRKPVGKNYEIQFWNPKTNKSGKVLVSEGNYNKVMQQLEEAGLTVEKPKDEKNYEISYWNPKTDKGGKVLVSENNYNKRVKQLEDAGFTVEKPESTPSPMKDFELSNYGKEVPELRGSKEYKNDRLKWIRETKEASPYVEALNKQIEVTTRKEGSNLRKEFYGLEDVKRATEVSEKYQGMQQALAESKTTGNQVATDQALITFFNKMTDPESVVRESEFARTPENIPLINRFKVAFKKIKVGGILTDDDREALIAMAKRLYDVSNKNYRSRFQEYKGYYTNYGLNPDKYLKPFNLTFGDGDEYSSMSDEEILKKLRK